MKKPLKAQQNDDQKTILVVDDEPEICNMMNKILSKKYRILTAKNGQEAIKKIEKNKISLIVLDMVLPGMKGVEVLKSVKLKQKKISVVILTGYGNISLKKETMKLGANAYIEKPFEIGPFRKIIDAILADNP